MPVRPTTRRPA